MSSKKSLEILKKSQYFEIRNIKLNYSKKISDIGKLNFSKIEGFFRVRRQIKKEIKNFNPDLIYFVPATSGMGLYRDYFFVEEIRKYFKKQILFHIRSRILKKDWENLFIKKILTSIFLGQKIIILGKELIRDLHSLTKKEDIFVLPNAIENQISNREFKELIKIRKKKDSFEILFLSNMDESKGWFKLLEACKILYDQNINFKCKFAGDWPGKKEEKKFFNFIKRNNLEKNVFYLGKKIGKEKNKILQQSNVLVFPTEYNLETFGRVIIEAMMFGLPLVANGIASIPTIVQQGKTGFILKKNSPEEIVFYIKKLKDKDLQLKMGEAGRKRFLKKYEIKNYSNKFIELLRLIS